MDYQIVSKINKQLFMFFVSLLMFSLLPYSLCIVNRDLVLTPKQGLQLSGKRIFYEENINSEKISLNNNVSAAVTGTRPWERTLKHVTYLTLFTNAANGIITGNFSKVKEYKEFLNSAYVHSPETIDSRFGDIVTLAQGRLETMSNGSYRFMEGNCDYECAHENNIIAMWHVQKIRHRDTADRKYHYEMKFSVSPITSKTPTETIVRGGPNKRTIMEEPRNNVQTFIQKEDDYPHSFRKILSKKDGEFLERRYDATRNFRQVSPHYHTQQVTPIPEGTFLRGVYQHPSRLQPAMMQLTHPNVPQQHSVHAHSHLQHNLHHHHHHQQQLPLPERLNIGEFYKGSHAPKATSKIEIFPNLLNMFMGKPHSLPPPSTTFRPPTYQMKFPRPEIYNQQQHQNQEFPKFSEYQPHLVSQSHEQFNQRTPSSMPIVTHHYHHHFFMPNNSAVTIEQAIHHNSEQSHGPSAEIYHNEVTEVTAPEGYIGNFNEEPHITTTLKQQQFPQIQHQLHNQFYPNIQQQNYPSSYQIQQLMPPAPQKFVFPNTQIEQQRVVLVTPAPPLRKPQYTQQQQTYENHPFTSSLEYTTVHVPLLISYPAPINQEKSADLPTPRNKPFVESEPIEDNIQYSEPDPLYANDNAGEIDNENKFHSNRVLHKPDQVQKPQLESPEHYDNLENNHKQSNEVPDNKKEHSESVEAQVPAPNNNKQHTEETTTSEDDKGNIPVQTTSQSTTTIQITTDKNIQNSINPEASNSTLATKKRPKIFAIRNKRINLKTGTTTPSTSTTKNPQALPPPSSMSITTESTKSFTISKPKKLFVSTSSTEPPLKTVSRQRNSYARTSSTSTTTTEKPVLKWTPKRRNVNAKFTSLKSTTPANENTEDETNENYDKEDNDENEDFKANESNNLRITKQSKFPTTTDDFASETTSEIANAITSSLSSTMSTLSSTPQSPSPLHSQASQADTDIYEVLTQKSVSKSVSLKVGYNGEEIPVIVDDEENEVKKV